MSNAGNSEAGGITYSGFFGQKFFTNGTQRMVIKRYGNVGIGTTDPQSKLHVSSDSDPTIIVGTTIANQANSGKISFRELPNISEFELRYNGSSNRFDIWNSVGGEAISILRSNSNVGIGDTDPDAKLTVFRTSTSFATALSTAESRAGLSVKSTSTYDAKLTVSTGTSGIQQIQGVNNAATTGRDIAINPYGGNVGIGTPIPSQKLSIAPDTDVSAEIGKAHIGLVGYANYAGFSHVDQNTNAQAYALLQSEDGQTFINANTGKNIWFRIANSDKMILNSSGNVGIGTTNPQSLLQVGHTGTTSNVAVRAQSGDSYQVGFEAYGSSQGTGYMYVGQSNTYGGGVAYNGDGNPASFDSGTIGNDKITFFRRDGGTDTAVIWYQYNSNDVNFRGDVIAYATSDEKLKDNINLIPNSIEKIKALRGVTFEWNEKSNKEVGKKEIGVIAQDVEKVLPEIVKTRDNGYKAVDYQKLTAVLIEAIKEQQKQIDELKAIINGGSK
jgi:hypothetical protein